MNRQDRKKLLADALLEANRIAEKKAETSKEYPTCPGCGMVLEGWKPDDVTGDSTTNDDEDNEGDRPDVDGDDDDDSDDRELDAAGKSRVVAEILANHKRHR